jgi:hypothetical protein
LGYTKNSSCPNCGFWLEEGFKVTLKFVLPNGSKDWRQFVVISLLRKGHIVQI